MSVKLSDLPKVRSLLEERTTLKRLIEDRPPNVQGRDKWELVLNRYEDGDEASYPVPAGLVQQILQNRLETVETELTQLGIELDDAPTT